MSKSNSVSPDDFFSQGIYDCAATINGVDYYGLLIVMKGSGFYAQLLISADNTFVRRNTNQNTDSWKAWKEL